MDKGLIILFKNRKTGQYIKSIDFDSRTVVYAPSIAKAMQTSDRFVIGSDIEADNVLSGIQAYLPPSDRNDIVKVKFREVSPPMTTLPGFR